MKKFRPSRSSNPLPLAAAQSLYPVYALTESVTKIQGTSANVDPEILEYSL